MSILNPVDISNSFTQHFLNYQTALNLMHDYFPVTGNLNEASQTYTNAKNAVTTEQAQIFTFCCLNEGCHQMYLLAASVLDIWQCSPIRVSRETFDGENRHKTEKRLSCLSGAVFDFVISFGEFC